MTQTEIAARLAEIARLEDELRNERYVLVVLTEEAEGRPESHEAKFARAYLAGDTRALDRLHAEGQVEYLRRYGRWPQQEVRDLAERIATGEA